MCVGKEQIYFVLFLLLLLLVFFKNSFVFYLFIFGCIGSSLLRAGFLQLQRAEAQQLWRTGLVAPRHVGSSQIRDQTRVPCTGRRILNHCATREVPAVACLCSVGDLTAFLPLVWDDPVHVGEVDDAGEKKKRLFWEVLKMPKIVSSFSLLHHQLLLHVLGHPKPERRQGQKIHS